MVNEENHCQRQRGGKSVSVQQHTAVSSNSSGPALDYAHGKLQMGMLSSDVNLTVFSLDFCNGLNLEGPGQSHVWSS